MPSWFFCPAPTAQAPVRLFCFPYAGGGVPAFRSWPQALPEIEIWIANLPGRGSRFSERLLTSMPDLVEALARHLPLNDDRPFAFLGHSMGARVAFELARGLRGWRRPLPTHLFVAACPAPQLPPRSPVHNLPPAAFLAELQRRGGIPAEILAEPELLDLLLPIVRADLLLYETAVYRDEPPLISSITAFGGQEDPIVSFESLSAWSAQTSGTFQQMNLPGDHFFLHPAPGQLFRAIQTTLLTNAPHTN
jgi:medium-chain acyl-[acyl-carrier-protein] hydrolase